MKNKKYLTVKEYALKNGVTERTVYNWIKEKKVKTKKIYSSTVIED